MTVDLGERSYDILIGDGLLATAGETLRPILSHPHVVIVTDNNVGPLYLHALEHSLNAAGIDNTNLTLPAGEPTKDFAHLGRSDGSPARRRHRA